MSSRCKACNKILTNRDLYIDDELCQYCIATIRSDFSFSKLQKFNEAKDIEINDDQTDL